MAFDENDKDVPVAGGPTLPSTYGLPRPVRYEVETIVPQRTRRIRRKVSFGPDQAAEATALAREYMTRLIVHYDDGKRRYRCPWTGKRAKRGWRPEHTAMIDVARARKALEEKLLSATPPPKK